MGSPDTWCSKNVKTPPTAKPINKQTNKTLEFFEEGESTILKGKTWGESSP